MILLLQYCDIAGVDTIKHHTITVAEEFGENNHCLCKYVYGYSDKFFPHNHKFFELFLVVKGTVEHWINGETQKLPEGSLIFIRPWDIHGFLYNNPKCKNNVYINLSFTKETAEALFTYLSDDDIRNTVTLSPKPPSSFLSSRSKNKLIDLLDELYTIDKNDIRLQNLRVKTILSDILTQYFTYPQKSVNINIPIWLTDLTKEMENIDNFTSGIDRMITLSGKSREHLSRCLKKHYGVTITEYINSLRTNYAANLLINSNMQIIDICYTSGFQNLGYFYKIFKETYSTTPNEFKKHYSNVKGAYV